jgi:hypothetical protein
MNLWTHIFCKTDKQNNLVVQMAQLWVNTDGISW